MPKTTPMNCPRAYIQSLPPVSCGRRSTWRLARSAVIVLGGCALVGAGVLLHVAQVPPPVFASPLPIPCQVPLPQPGPARPWEAEVQVSTYSWVNTRHGNLFTAIPIVSWSGIGPDMNMMLYHNSANVISGYSVADVVGFDLGPGWSISYSDHLRLNELPDRVTAVAANGRQDVFWWSSSQQRWVPPGGVYDTLYEDTQTGKWILKHKDQSYHQFSFSGCDDSIWRLEKIVDATGNEATVSYTTCNPPNPTPVVLQSVTAGGRPLNFVFGESGPDAGRLLNLVDPRDEPPCVPPCSPHERKWTFRHDDLPGGTGWLQEIEDAMQYENPYYGGYRNEITYDGMGRLGSVSDKYHTRPNSPPKDVYGFAYHTDGKVRLVNDPSGSGGGRTQQFTYRCYEPNPMDFEPERHLQTLYLNRRSAAWIYSYATCRAYTQPVNSDTLESISDSFGTTNYFYDQGRDLVRYTDANNNVWEATYDSNGNRLTATDPLNHVQQWTYDQYNNLTSHTDANGNQTTFEYAHSLSLGSMACSAGSANAGALCKRCEGGAFPGEACVQDSECSGGTCIADDRLCSFCDAGPFTGANCSSDADCPGGQCLPGVCDVPVTLPPRAPTLLTSITEPADAPGNPPAVTTLDYYLHRQGEPWGPRGALKEVIDPNGVWTGFEYDQWGQQAAYREGKYASAVASGDQYVYVLDTPQDSAGNTTGNDSSGGGGGSSTHDSTGNETSNTCMWRAALQAPGSGPNWFPFALPCNPPNLPERSAEFFSATYSPKGELQVLPLHLGVGTRTHTRTYDVMGRPLSVSVESNEAGGAAVTRTFTHAYDVPNGRYTRTGPDGVETFVQLDAANRVQFVRRGAEGAPLMTATYTYQANGFVDRVTYGNGTVAQYAYEGHRLASIEHLRAPGTGERLLRLDYEYDARDLPWRITEYGAGPVSTPTVQAVTTFAYDRRGRVTGEARMYFPDPSDATQNYYLEYGYDAGGNRTVKIDHYNLRRVEYHYDVDADADPAVYASRNNRLMWYETIDTAPNPDVTLSKTYYVYAYDSTDERRAGKSDGNVTRIITEHVGESAASGTEAGQRGLRGGDRPAFKAREAHDERAGDSSDASTAAACGAGETLYTAVRLGYAANGQAVTFAHDESWCWDPLVGGCPTNYQIGYAREFRYDGTRARYMNRQLDPVGLVLYPPVYAALSTTWSDYDGDEIHGDFTVSGSTVTNTDAYQPGLWNRIGGTANYLHNDHIGTLRQITSATGVPGASRLFTAFGERLPGSATDRFGYVGAWGYQDTLGSGGAEVFPYLHVGARYYDPSTGRFLQRDPIGIRAGFNVYAYVSGSPTRLADPFGLYGWGDFGNDLVDVGGVLVGVGSAVGLIAGGSAVPGANTILVGGVLVGIGCAIDFGNRHLPPADPPEHFPFCDPHWGSCPPDARRPPYTGGHRW